jgi:hypothetical protein
MHPSSSQGLVHRTRFAARVPSLDESSSLEGEQGTLGVQQMGEVP